MSTIDYTNSVHLSGPSTKILFTSQVQVQKLCSPHLFEYRNIVPPAATDTTITVPLSHSVALV